MRIRHVAFATGDHGRRQVLAPDPAHGGHTGQMHQASPVMFPPPGPASFQKVGGRQEEGQPAFTHDPPESFPHLRALELHTQRDAMVTGAGNGPPMTDGCGEATWLNTRQAADNPRGAQSGATRKQGRTMPCQRGPVVVVTILVGPPPRRPIRRHPMPSRESGGESGIRTHVTGEPVNRISSPAHSTTLPSLRRLAGHARGRRARAEILADQRRSTDSPPR